jgi:hypothetical protein
VKVISSVFKHKNILEHSWASRGSQSITHYVSVNGKSVDDTESWMRSVSFLSRVKLNLKASWRSGQKGDEYEQTTFKVNATSAGRICEITVFEEDALLFR